MRIDGSTPIREIEQFMAREEGATNDKQIVFGRPEHTVADAERLFLKYNVHHLPIVADGQKLVGIVTVFDLMKVHAQHPGAGSDTITLQEIMTRDVTVISPFATLRDAVHALAHAMFQALPVVREDGRIIGLVTTRDLVAALDKLLKDSVPPSPSAGEDPAS